MCSRPQHQWTGLWYPADGFYSTSCRNLSFLRRGNVWGNESEAMGHAPFAARRIIFICVFFAAVRGYRANRMFRMRDCKSRAPCGTMPRIAAVVRGCEIDWRFGGFYTLAMWRAYCVITKSYWSRFYFRRRGRFLGGPRSSFPA